MSKKSIFKLELTSFEHTTHAKLILEESIVGEARKVGNSHETYDFVAHDRVLYDGLNVSWNRQFSK